MSNADPFSVKIACPLCGNPDALMTLSAVKCPNPKCANNAAGAPPASPEPFTPSPTTLPAADPQPSAPEPTPQAPSPAPAPVAPKDKKKWVKAKNKPKAKPKAKPPQEPFNPNANRIEIKYRNHKGEEKTFTGDGSTAKASGKHLSLRIAPTGVRASFAKERILNWKDIAAALPNIPALPNRKPGGCGGCLFFLLLIGGIIWLMVSNHHH